MSYSILKISGERSTFVVVRKILSTSKSADVLSAKCKEAAQCVICVMYICIIDIKVKV